MSIDASLLSKYNVPVPRYTSYPTVPCWKEDIDTGEWMDVFSADYNHCNTGKGISLYIHLPFCESLCTYCGCNKRITTNHSVEHLYMEAIANEWQQYKALMGQPPVLKELHLGGGTPTFFSPQNLVALLQPILNDAVLPPDYEFSFEGHPNNTTPEHLQALYDLGFRRVSYGVQDNDAAVQRIINRLQPFENVKRATENARNIGYKSVNFDLIYGLPLQTTGSISKTIEQTISLMPDRIAFYSYAHVPWTSRGQRLFDENDLPSASEKLAMYLKGKQLLTEAGYHDIGMDHFALPHDELYAAQQEGRLHRNFMGYTTQSTDILLGLGVSAISSSPGAHVQNNKSLHDYYARLDNGRIPVNKGIFLTEEDKRFGNYIKDINCKGATTFDPRDRDIIDEYVLPLLTDLASDGLIVMNEHTVRVTATGRNFVRNICSAFDRYMVNSNVATNKPVFSRSV